MSLAILIISGMIIGYGLYRLEEWYAQAKQEYKLQSLFTEAYVEAQLTAQDAQTEKELDRCVNDLIALFQMAKTPAQIRQCNQLREFVMGKYKTLYPLPEIPRES